MSKLKIYLAGPMTGLPDFNRAAFHAAAANLRAEGHTVFSPAENDEEKYGEDILTNPLGDTIAASAKGFNLREALHDDLSFICLEATAIAMLPGWENSKGAQAEWATARALGHRIIYL